MAFRLNPIAEGVATSGGNLKSHQWKAINITFPKSTEITIWGARGIEWSVAVDNNTVKGLKDATVINDTFNKVYTGSITVLQSEIANWYNTFPELRGYSLVDFDKFQINISTADSYTILRGCKFTNDTRNYAQSSGEPEVTINLSIESIVMEIAYE